MPDESLWKVSDVAEFLSISERTVRAWQLDHKLPFLKIGGTVRFVPNEIRTWATDQEVRLRFPLFDAGLPSKTGDFRHGSDLEDGCTILARRADRPDERVETD